MQYCEQCKVSVRGGDSICPLCQHRLQGEKEEDLYPKLQTIYKKFELFFKLLIVGTISSAMICVGVNLILPQAGFWSLYAIFGLIGFWISLVNVLKRRDNLLKSIAVQAFVLTILCVILDFLMGWSNWSLDYFIPIAYSVELLSLYIIALVKRLPPEEYIIYMISALLFCIVPITLYLTGLLTVMLPSIICLVLSVITLVWLIVFEGKRLFWEFKKRFHL